MPTLVLTDAEVSQVARVRANVQHAVQNSKVVPYETGPTETWSYGGTIALFRYQVEGEEDLLHLIVDRNDGRSLTPEDGRTVAAHVLEGVAPGLIRLTPGLHSQHFYFGHEDFLRGLKEPAKP